MTTGRINQVTILSAERRPRPEAAPTRQPDRRSEGPKTAPTARQKLVSTRRSGRPEARRSAHSGGDDSREKCRPWAIKLPPLSSPKDGPPQVNSFGPGGRPRACDIRPSRGGYPWRRHADRNRRLVARAYPQKSDIES